MIFLHSKKRTGSQTVRFGIKRAACFLLIMALLSQVAMQIGCQEQSPTTKPNASTGMTADTQQTSGSQTSGMTSASGMTTGTAPPTSGNSDTSGTSATSQETQAPVSDGVKYSHEFIGSFDTLIQLIGYAPDKATFDQWSQMAEAAYRELHQLFDAYHTYDGINNIKTINDKAGLSPVIVDQRVIDLLDQTSRWRSELSESVDLTLGPVVAVWAEYREKALAKPELATPPTEERLATALLLSGAGDVQIDPQNRTVFLTRGGMRLDVGAVAKGYATEQVAKLLMASGVTSMIINAGGSSVRLIGKPGTPDRSSWNIAIQNPEVLLPSPDYVPSKAEPTLTVIRTTDTSIVTSGDYQRFYHVDDQIFHHLISPSDGMPVRHYRAVTVMAQDSGLADFLSTALFLMPFEDSRALVERLQGVEAMWVFAEGRVEMTPGLTAVADPIADVWGS